MFIYRANRIHGSRYDYTQVPERVGSRVVIICREHGGFERGVKEHFQRRGCPVCDARDKHKWVLYKFVHEARKVHKDLYSYPRVGEAQFPMVVVTCREHGDFEQSKYSHLRGSGCPICHPPFYRQSRVANRWLDSIGLPNDTKHREVKGLIPGKQFIVDGFDPDTNTVYEFYGDAYHGNPRLYDPGCHNPLTGTTYGQLNQERIDREQLLQEAGFNLVTMWEFDFKNPLGVPPKTPATATEEALNEFISENGLGGSR
jgi:hypothetical protein